MKYHELVKRINIEKFSNNFLIGKADSKDLDVCIKSHKQDYWYIHINGVQMRFKRLQLGMQTPDEEELWLIISGFHDEKCIRVEDIKELYFNRGWEVIHG